MDRASRNAPSSEAIMYLIHHMFLPPKLPQEDDFDARHEKVLLDTIVDTLLKFKDCVVGDQRNVVDSVSNMVFTLRKVRDSHGSVSERELGNAFGDLCQKGGMIVLHIRAQNAGVMISKVNNAINIETFELSPLNQDVITTKGRLRRSFPGPAFSLSLEIFAKAELQATMAHTLAKMSYQPAPETRPKVKKKGQMHDEDRDTAHPKMVTELLIGFLRSFGEPVDVSRLWKNTREDVMWLDSRLPWRRSSMWLLVRVAVQLVFSRSTASSNLSGDLYKEYLVFLMSHVLLLSQQYHFASDLMYAMNAKLARRLLKLDLSLDRHGLNFVQHVMRETGKVIHTRWNNYMEQDGSTCDLSRLKSLNFIQDISCSLPALDGYIESMIKRENVRNSAVFQPSFALIKYQDSELPPCLSFSTDAFVAYDLRAFETWVASSLNPWLEVQKYESSTCGKLGDLIQSYYSVAARFYSGNAEATSLMLLTILELWIACDKSAAQICNLLLDYDPQIPQDLLGSLVLPFKSQMERLLRIESYLENRRSRLRESGSNIFRDFGDASCFSARYFNQSLLHQNLKLQIESEATQKRQNKRDELHRKKEQYQSLIQRHDQSECEYVEIVTDSHNDFVDSIHSSNCKKCAYKSQADSISIEIHEWPLPSDAMGARSTVFELEVPASFGNWRETTVYLLLNVLKIEYLTMEKPRSNYTLKNYGGLSSFLTRFRSEQRIGLLSQIKPHEGTHRKNKCIATTTEREICLENALRYQYYDTEMGCFVDNFGVTDEMSQLCTYKLPAQSSSLQQFLSRPPSMPSGPPPNTAIASQSNCPDNMSLDEYKALSTIPLGYRIQWQNILLQVSVPSIDLKKVETGLVILQAIHQAGPPRKGNSLRVSHEIVDDETFANSLLKTLSEALQRVKENWESSQALATFVSLAIRLLSLTSTERIKDQCIIFLAMARGVAFAWVNLLKDKASKATNDVYRTDLISKAVEIALICVDSFSVDERHLVDLLAIKEEASILIQCHIIVNEGDHSVSNTSNPMVPILYQRWKCLSYRSYPILAREILQKGSECLDDSIKKAWTAYESGHGWQVVSELADYWLVSQTKLRGNTDLLWIHFNMLTGELLVNGLPLARLPTKYESHPTYRTLFGYSTLEVMPTTVKGMEFSGKKEFAGWTLHFGLSPIHSSLGFAENDLLIQAVKDNRKFELIPSRLLRGEFPLTFVEQFVHWYDVNNDSLEFRPIENPWTSSSDNWRLIRDGVRSEWRLRKKGLSMVGVKNETAQILSRVLSAVEDPLQIHAIFHHNSSSLEILLPRLQLGFYLSSGTSSIQSKQFRGMSVDTDQSLGTLVGLRNKLMLKNNKNENRLVVVPEGRVTYQKNRDHVCVIIDKGSITKAHTYNVDGEIGRLVDNGSLQSKLYLCYLHALTSFCLPDPLLHMTGTEQALSILNSAAVRSFDQLGQENIEILDKIARLTPGRKYYPANERVMQSVQWSPQLGFMAQHGWFYKFVKQIFNQADTTKLFYPQSYIEPPELAFIEPELAERDSIRSSTFRVSSFGAEDHTVRFDVAYLSRDRDQDSAGGLKASTMSSMIYQGRTTLPYDVPSDLGDRLWTSLSRASETLGPNRLIDSSELLYDAGLLWDLSEFIPQHWITLHQTLSRGSPRYNKFRLMMWLSTLAFAKNRDINIVQTLASFFAVPDTAQSSVPQISSFRLGEGRNINQIQLRSAVETALIPFYSCPEQNLALYPGESSKSLRKRRKREFQSNQACAIKRIVDELKSQWPCEIPTTPAGIGSAELRVYIDIGKATEEVKPKFKTWFDNQHFYEYLHRIQDSLRSHMVGPIRISPCLLTVPIWNIERRPGFICAGDILNCPAPSVSPAIKLDDLLSSVTPAEKPIPRLTALMQRIEAHAGSKYEQKYVEDLRESLASLQKWENEYRLQPTGNDLKAILLTYLNSCKDNVHTTYSAICSTIGPAGQGEQSSQTRGYEPSAAAASVNQWPRVSPIFFLKELTKDRWRNNSDDWKKCIVHYGIALTELQRAERLVNFSDNHADLVKELQNSGHTNWSPFDNPESLLLEVESGIMIREAQQQVAEQMKNPSLGGNAVMQLNMGEGKSSVIVPIVAAALADSSQLVRVIVAKPQSKQMLQMLQMLVSKLGGLLDRRVYHMPFSRALRLGEEEANSIGNIYKECMASGGILLVQPEHILSFKLMGLECLISGKESVGRSLLRTQKFFDSSSRDIVDESDENFSVKFELIYTMGLQRPIELSPERWVCIQQVLDLVKMFAPTAKEELPYSIEVDERWPGGFPRTRILRSDAQQRMLDHIAKQICEFGLDGFPIARQQEPARRAVFRYITEPNLTQDEIDRVERAGSGGFWTDTTSSTLLLIRGLIAGGVLAFAMGQKRWRVNYGPDMAAKARTRLAVPYRAKDSPTPRSEFSHPDVVVVLTSLSYYYDGLNDDDLFVALSHLIKSDQADTEYQAWVLDAPTLPAAFHQLIGINLKDRFQCIEQLFPPLRYAKGVVDYFLGHIVFPKEMKEFPHKLSASGWDIGQTKSHPTTGFSGTNDSRTVLPLSVKHLDLQEQKHTNALVLEYLLQPENSVELIVPRGKASSSDAVILLEMVKKMKPSTQVILDVGAQILELDNLEVAREWLKMMPDHDRTQAAIFFDDEDELSVLDRNGHIEHLQTSPFAKKLDVCVVFLDEAHTRGTDLKLPEYYRAAVTLGANLTKDRLVQACMRMRKLGKGQSVVFLVPEEIKTKILGQKFKPYSEIIDVSDVLCWAISETHIDIRRSMPLWAAQGKRFELQSELYANGRTVGEAFLSRAQAEKFLENESQSLEYRYRPRDRAGEVNVQVSQNKNIDLIIKRCREFDNLELSSAALQEEQERELSPEIEQERQIEKPAPAQPATHRIHPDLIKFVSTGVLNSGSKAYKPAFESLRDTSAAKHLEVSQFPGELLVTTDFASTVQAFGNSYISDAYQRPVQWILTSAENGAIKNMIIISPHEAQKLLPEIKESKTAALQLYTPRPNLAFRALDGLDLYTVPAQPQPQIVPRRLVVQLNLFAGQLYLGSFQEYVELCAFLGLASENTDGSRMVDADGFVMRDGSGEGRSRSTFSDSPIKFLKVFMTKIRRNCEGIEKTHIGRILDGRLLLPADFEKTAAEA